jgi:hypothetical protein
MHPLAPNPTGYDGSSPIRPWLRRLVGSLALASGFVLLVFLIWATYRITVLGRKPDWLVVAFCGVVVAMTVFFLFIGYRLIFNRPNQHGSMLPPSGWYALGSVFGLVALGIAAPLVWVGLYDELIPAGCALVLAAWCFRAARGRTPRGTPRAL